jgi:beta-mannosidase
MKQALQLDGPWQLCGFDGYGERIDAEHLPEALANLPWIDARVPGSIYRDLMRAGWIADVYADCNSLAAQWVETHYWYYRTTFARPDGDANTTCHLVLDGLDYAALIFLNGTCVGRHANAFRPWRADVTGLLRTGENELTVRLDCGLFRAADLRGGDCNLEVTALTTKRAYLRKPQYTFRWDWSPRLISVGIGRPARLEVFNALRLDDVAVSADATGRVMARAWAENATDTPLDAAIRVTVAREDGEGQPVAVDESPAAKIESRTRMLTTETRVIDPSLWWPRGFGDQPLYDVRVELLHAGAAVDQVTRRVGFRTVELRQPPAADGGTLFQIAVNDEPIFCKGANWVPADLLWQGVTDDDYTALVDLAVEANCNLLRIWGGGLYADPALLAACDRAGVLVWHDLPFACTKYPGDTAFGDEVRTEIRHNVRARTHHPSLILWCGNNEVEMGVHDGWIDSYDSAATPDRKLFFEEFPKLLAAEDDTRPYWPSSPWSPDGSPPNAPHSGDQHPWEVSLGEPRGDYRHYLSDTSRFPNEGGMMGPSTLKTLHAILPETSRHVGSRIWRHHDNPQNTMRREPLVDHLLRVNLVADPARLSFDDYVTYGGILHGEALATAIDHWRARKFDTSAAIFWMFNDTWPAVVSWTPIDYYRRRKAAFWYVRRAFAPLRAVCTVTDRDVTIHVLNDTRREYRLVLRYGLFGLTGGRPVDESCDIVCPPNAALPAGRIPLSAWDQAGPRTHGAFAVLTANGVNVSVQRVFRERFRDLAWAPASVSCVREGDTLLLASDHFAWSVCLDSAGEQPRADNYCDLIPGIPQRIAWPVDAPLPQRIAAANPGDLMAGK